MARLRARLPEALVRNPGRVGIGAPADGATLSG